MFSFKPLRKLLVERDMDKMDFVELMGISPSTASKIWKGEYVAMKIVDDICNKFKVSIEEVIEHIPDEK